MVRGLTFCSHLTRSRLTTHTFYMISHSLWYLHINSSHSLVMCITVASRLSDHLLFHIVFLCDHVSFFTPRLHIMKSLCSILFFDHTCSNKYIIIFYFTSNHICLTYRINIQIMVSSNTAVELINITDNHIYRYLKYIYNADIIIKHKYKHQY